MVAIRWKQTQQLSIVHSVLEPHLEEIVCLRVESLYSIATYTMSAPQV